MIHRLRTAMAERTAPLAAPSPPKVSFEFFPPKSEAASAQLWATIAALQPLRAWTLISLGRFWTTRVITLPGAAPVARGAYRWMRHPNYAIVALELALLPLAFGLWWLALAATVANAFAMRERLRVENAALAATAPSSPRRS